MTARDQESRPARRTKLVCTLGPASVERVGELVAAGMDVARLNFSHGKAAAHEAGARAVRSAAREAGRRCDPSDLAGPNIRIGELGERGG